MDYLRIETEGGLIIASGFDSVALLNAKIQTMMLHMGKMEKDKQYGDNNSRFGYSYVSYEQTANAARQACEAAGLAFMPSVIDISSEEITTKQGTPMVIRKVLISITLADKDTGAMHVTRWAGEGADTLDKATAKAITSAIKYFWLRATLTSDQDDVDPDAQGGELRDRKEQQTTQEKHWTQDNTSLTAFWNWCYKDMELTKAEVVAVMGDPSKFKGDKAEAKHLIENYAAGKKDGRPYTPEEVKNKVEGLIKGKPVKAATPATRSKTVSALDQLFEGGPPEKLAARSKATEYLIGKPSSSEYTEAECSALMTWMVEKLEDGSEIISDHAIKEAAMILNLVNEQNGQGKML